MKPFRNTVASAIVALLGVLAFSAPARADIAPRWSPQELAQLSSVIVTGRVSAIASAWDANNIYTYVTIDTDSVFRGTVASRQIVLKQLGGIVGEMGLEVAGQPEFSIGEDVLVFAEVRPRDGTLYTTALWQGKWTLEDGGRSAVQRDGDVVTARLAMDSVRESASPAVAVTEAFVAVPPETPLGYVDSPFNLGSSPIKWIVRPAVVDIAGGGQPGLSGGGLVQLNNSFTQWNNAGSNFAFAPRSVGVGARCGTFNSSTFIVFVANDPCGEISNSGGVLAVASIWFTTAVAEVFNGVGFRRIVEVTVTTNDSSTAQQFMTNAPCFQEVMEHEFGHALGLDHTSDASAIMFATVSFAACSAGPKPLQPDDIAGVRFIYGTSGGGGAPGKPTVTSAVAAGGVLRIVWASGAGAPPTSHVLNFFAGSTPVAQVPTGPGTSVDIPLPPGVAGTFNVTVTPFNGSTPGPASDPFIFSIGGGPGCSGPPAAPNVQGGIVAGTATVTWTSPGATSYLIQAGTAPGSANLVPLTNVGTAGGISVPGLPPGFQAWLRVFAENACGRSAPTDFLVR